MEWMYSIWVYLRHFILSGEAISPYEYIAIDLNNSGTIDEIEQWYLKSLILRTVTAFPNNNKPWKIYP